MSHSLAGDHELFACTRFIILQTHGLFNVSVTWFSSFGCGSSGCLFCCYYCSSFFSNAMNRLGMEILCRYLTHTAISIYRKFEEEAHELLHSLFKFWFVLLVWRFLTCIFLQPIQPFRQSFPALFCAHGANHLVLVNFEIKRAINNWWVLATIRNTDSE